MLREIHSLSNPAWKTDSFISNNSSVKGSEIKGKFVKINKKKKLLAQLDGEEFPPADHFEIAVHKQMLKLIVPSDFHWI